MTYASRLDLADEARNAILPILQARLSDTLDLQARLKAAHWNMKGALHALFDQMATEVAEASDDLAERLVTLGGNADGRPVTTEKGSSLPPWPLVTKGEEVLAALWPRRLRPMRARCGRPSTRPRPWAMPERRMCSPGNPG